MNNPVQSGDKPNDETRMNGGVCKICMKELPFENFPEFERVPIISHIISWIILQVRVRETGISPNLDVVCSVYAGFVNCSVFAFYEVANMEDFSGRLSCLSIIVDDVDDKKNRFQVQTTNEARVSSEPEATLQTVQNPYPKQVLDDAIRDILEEAELRKFEFRKLLDEHDALIENLKKMINLTGRIS